MKNYWKITTLSLAAALTLVVGSNFVSGQATTAVTPVPATGTAGTGGAPGARAGRGPASHQPRMDMALVRLRAARADLDLALPDKGGHREIAIRDIDQAIKSVEEGIKYAEEHPEEFPGRRGGRGPRGDTTPPATTTTTTAVGG